MAQDWISVLKADPIDWLLEPENPSVRYFALRDLLGYPEDAPEVLEAREAIRRWEKVSRIFSKQRAEGYWESAERPYHPKYKGTYWQIMILGQMGLDKGDERVRRACEYVFGYQHERGGFSSYTLERASEEYDLVKAKGKKLPAPEEWTVSHVFEHQYSCLTGNMVAALIQLGYADDPRVRKALDWLVKVQNQDGGWLCPYWKAHIRDKHSCFMGTITPLDAFSEVPLEDRTAEMKATIQHSVEFLLMHRLFKADHHDFRVINESWLKFGFPSFFYDILRGLQVVTRLGYAKDERINDALELLLKKQNSEGKWILESTPSGRMQTDLEKKGKPSKWVTLNALKVIKALYQT
jgi:hypothetical protein